MLLSNDRLGESFPWPRVRVTGGSLEGLEGEVVNTEEDNLVIALVNSPGVYLVVNSDSVTALRQPPNNPSPRERLGRR